MITLIFSPLTTRGDVFVSDVELGGVPMYVVRKNDSGTFDAVCTDDDCVISTHRSFDQAAQACSRDYSMSAVLA